MSIILDSGDIVLVHSQASSTRVETLVTVAAPAFLWTTFCVLLNLWNGMCLEHRFILKKSDVVVAFAANIMFVDRRYINPCERTGVTLV